MSDCPHPLQLACQRLIKFDRRLQEQITIRKAHDRHPCSERQRYRDATHGQVLEWPIDYSDVRPHRLKDVDWFVERGTHSHLPDSFLAGVSLIAGCLQRAPTADIKTGLALPLVRRIVCCGLDCMAWCKSDLSGLSVGWRRYWPPTWLAILG